MLRLDEALELVGAILRQADDSHHIAIGRAQLAAGQALAWTGTEAIPVTCALRPAGWRWRLTVCVGRS